jgi:(E)-4-hydroxy-3-methylbut-2-enyl-diphosphate synthase
MPALRRFFFELISQGIKLPVVIWRQYETMSTSDFQLFSATDLGGLLVDGLGMERYSLFLKTPQLQRFKVWLKSTMQQHLGFCKLPELV